MGRPNQTRERRAEVVPILADTFAELGYRRATIAELAQRCGVRQNILYRLWPDKKAMFIASIAYVFQSVLDAWQDQLRADDRGQRTVAERLLDYESRHHGQFGRYRIVFAGLNETDDPEIRQALKGMYVHFQRLVRDQVRAHRRQRNNAGRADDELAAWAVVGLGTVANIARELKMISATQRRRLFVEIGHILLDGIVD